MTATQALAQALVAHQPRYYGTPGYWATAVGEMAPDILANLRAAGWVLVPLVDACTCQQSLEGTHNGNL